MTKLARFLSTLLLSTLIFVPIAAAERVSLEHDGLTLVAHLQQVAPPEDGVVLILHGTLAHGRMEMLAAIQDLLAEQSINSLAVNLSYGIDDRTGMFECDRPVTHGLGAHFAELDAWLAWLSAEGYGPVVLLGHSRGGNQVARFYADQAPEAVAGLILVAPGTYDPEQAAANFAEQAGLPLLTRLDQARELLRMDQAETLMSEGRFLYCAELAVSPEAFLGYYEPNPAHDTPTVVAGLAIPTLVIIGSEDTVVADLPERMAEVPARDNLAVVTIDGADHFFRDFFADDVVEAVVEFIGQ